MNKQETIQYVKDKLADPSFYQYDLLAHMLRDHVNEEDESLRTLAFLLGSGHEYCAKGDVQFIVDSLEEKAESDK